MPSKEYTSITDSTKPTISSDFFLLSSSFKDFSDNIINCTINSIRLLHSLCTYTNITRNSENGGCVFFNCSSSIVQDRFYATKCYTPDHGKYSYTVVQRKENKNFVNLSSLCQCGQDYSGDASILHQYGNKTLISTNNTKSRCNRMAGYRVRINPVNVNFCCFISNDNPIGTFVGMYHYDTPDSFVKRSLFRNNTCKIGDTHWGLIGSESSFLTVSECIFLENIAPHTIGIWYGILTVTHCIVDSFTASSTFHGIIYTNEMKTDCLKIGFSLPSIEECKTENLKPFEHGKNKLDVLKFIFSFNIFYSEKIINEC